MVLKGGQSKRLPERGFRGTENRSFVAIGGIAGGDGGLPRPEDPGFNVDV